MAEIFVDTAGWASFFVKTEPKHVLAVSVMKAFQATGHRIVTTNYVLSELVALLTSPLRTPRPRVISLLDAIQAAVWIDIVYIDAATDAEAYRLLRARPDKSWSLVDCASFVIMQRREILQALTTDHHFEQAGFTRLLK